jgi:hypothetical protein
MNNLLMVLESQISSSLPSNKIKEVILIEEERKEKGDETKENADPKEVEIRFKEDPKVTEIPVDQKGLHSREKETVAEDLFPHKECRNNKSSIFASRIQDGNPRLGKEKRERTV